MKTTLLILLLGLSASAQNFAVLLARDDPSAPAGMPQNWPTRVQPIGAATSSVSYPTPPWRIFTEQQVRDWKAANESLITAYLAAKEAEEAAAKQTKANALLTTLNQIANSTGNLSAAQLSEAVRALSRAILFMVKSGQIDATRDE